MNDDGMAAASEPVFVVRTPQQRRVLTSPLRMEILEQFAIAAALSGSGRRREAGRGAASIADIGRRMGRRPDSLYHHVRVLTRAGLLVAAGTRKAGKRDETLYRPVALTIAMHCDPSQSSSVKFTVAMVATMFRLAEREMRAALTSKAAVPAGPQRTFFTRRLPAHLSPAALREVNRHIDAILEVAERERIRCAAKPAELVSASPVSITIALLPMTARQRVKPATVGTGPC